MSDYLQSLCGTYRRADGADALKGAVRYDVRLVTEDNRATLSITTEYGDGRTNVQSVPGEDLNEAEEFDFDLKARVLERLKEQWDFQPDRPDNQVFNDRVFTFDVLSEVDRFFSASSLSLAERPEFVVLTGGVCSGKSTLRRQLYPDHVVIDAGEVFLNLSGDEYFDFGAMFEEPLELIGSSIARKAIRERRNIVTEIIGDQAEVNRLLLDAIMDGGFEPKLVPVFCDIETAWERNINRGNNISAHVCQPYHIRWILDEFKRMADEFEEEEAVDEPYFDGAFFPITSEKSFLKAGLLDFVRKLIAENDIPAEDVRKLSTLILGLERLPRTTVGLETSLMIAYYAEGESNCYELELSENRFSMSNGGNVYTPGVGSDSFGNTLFECESTGFHDGSIWDFQSWIESASELLDMGAEIKVHDDSDADALPWDQTLEGEPFDELDERIKRWEEYLGDG